MVAKLEFSEGDVSGIELEIIKSKISGILSLEPRTPRYAMIVKNEIRDIMDALNSPRLSDYRSGENEGSYHLLRNRFVTGDIDSEGFRRDLHSFGSVLGITDSPATQGYSESQEELIIEPL